jgi:adenosine deaminase CECR1
VNPLSNQVLKYVADLRLHPAVAYHNYGIPISISPDDPSRFGVHGATFDWFLTVVCFRFKLKDLKKVARGSIKHALCGEDLKTEMLAQFDAQWREFVAGLLKK